MDNETDRAPMGEIYNAPPQPPGRPPKCGGTGGKMVSALGGCLCGCLFSILAPVLLFTLLTGSCAVLMTKMGDSEAFITNESARNVIECGLGDRQIAVIPVKGIIGYFSGDSIFSNVQGGNAERIIRDLKRAEQDTTVAAVILDMNTPGGEVVASDEVRQVLDRMETPVVTVMHSMAASGGYYIASGSEWIVANPMTLTGSIGVIMQGVEYKGLMEKLGLKPVVYRSGDFKDIFSGSREATPEEKEYLNQMVRDDFTRFCEVVSQGRSQRYPTVEDVKAAVFGDGRPLLGSDAFALGLVDELGDISSAIAKARELGDCPYGQVVRYGSSSPFRSLFTSLSAVRNPKVQIEGLTPGLALPMGTRFYLMPDAVR